MSRKNISLRLNFFLLFNFELAMRMNNSFPWEIRNVCDDGGKREIQTRIESFFSGSSSVVVERALKNSMKLAKKIMLNLSYAFAKRLWKRTGLLKGEREWNFSLSLLLLEDAQQTLFFVVKRLCWCWVSAMRAKKEETRHEIEKENFSEMLKFHDRYHRLEHEKNHSSLRN